jgi:UDP-N-acetylmuramoylalanine-D-glutamate ligase
MPSLPTAAVIGAGSSGIAAAKALHERGIPFTCFGGFRLSVALRTPRPRVPA